jgi:hypothetical protein
MIKIRKFVTIVEEAHSEAGISANPPLRKVAVAAIFNNPYAGRYSEDLGELIAFNAPLGQIMAEKLVGAMGQPIVSLGKGALIGIDGEALHGNACLLGEFANPIREAVGGGLAWIQSTTKRSTLGGTIDIPLAHKDALFVRANYDTISVHVADGPRPDELVVIIAAANRSYLNARLGGLLESEISARDGLR